jgi:hypothetical protein
MEENKGVVLDELLDQVDLNLKVPYLTQVNMFRHVVLVLPS